MSQTNFNKRIWNNCLFHGPRRTGKIDPKRSSAVQAMNVSIEPNPVLPGVAVSGTSVDFWTLWDTTSNVVSGAASGPAPYRGLAGYSGPCSRELRSRFGPPALPGPFACRDQAGTKPRTTRNIMGNDRGPSGKPTRYPARTCCSIEPRASSESAINMPVTLPGPSVNVAQ